MYPRYGVQVPLLVPALLATVSSMGAFAHCSEQSECKLDNCLRALRNPTRAAAVNSLCQSFLATTTTVTATTAIPTFLTNCGPANYIPNVSSACSCLSPAIATPSGSTPLLPPASSSPMATLTPAPTPNTSCPGATTVTVTQTLPLVTVTALDPPTCTQAFSNPGFGKLPLTPLVEDIRPANVMSPSDNPSGEVFPWHVEISEGSGNHGHSLVTPNTASGPTLQIQCFDCSAYSFWQISQAVNTCRPNTAYKVRFKADAGSATRLMVWLIVQGANTLYDSNNIRYDVDKGFMTLEFPTFLVQDYQVTARIHIMDDTGKKVWDLRVDDFEMVAVPPA